MKTNAIIAILAVSLIMPFAHAQQKPVPGEGVEKQSLTGHTFKRLDVAHLWSWDIESVDCELWQYDSKKFMVCKAKHGTDISAFQWMEDPLPPQPKPIDPIPSAPAAQ